MNNPVFVVFMGQVFLKVHPFPHVSTIPTMIHIHLSFNTEFSRREKNLYKKRFFYGYQGVKDGKYLNIIFLSLQLMSE